MDKKGVSKRPDVEESGEEQASRHVVDRGGGGSVVDRGSGKMKSSADKKGGGSRRDDRESSVEQASQKGIERSNKTRLSIESNRNIDEDNLSSETDGEYSMTQTSNQRKRKNSQSPNIDIAESKKKTSKISRTPPGAISVLDSNFIGFDGGMQMDHQEESQTDDCPTSNNCESNLNVNSITYRCIPC